ncbi:MAG: hypothetical protein E7034_09835 [Akkermansiaceae bacterium]|nr:hypothetical protein [Akkermansiaceae bacterium]
MGLMEQLAAMAIRKKVSATLRENCPVDLKSGLEDLLADEGAIGAIQKILTAGMKNPISLRPDSLKSQLLASAAAAILEKCPGLVDYLVKTASSFLKR